MTILELQVLLKKAGNIIKVDGIIGNETINALKSFQALHGLEVTGKLTPETYTRLNTYSNVDISGMVYKPEVIKAIIESPIKSLPIENIKPITDKPTLDAIAQLHPVARLKVTLAVQKANARLTGNAQVRIVQGLRTFAYQDKLYAQGRTTPGNIVTNARGGQSIHNYALAVDFALLVNGKVIEWNTIKDYDGDGLADWTEVVITFKAEGFMWGGDWKGKLVDRPHFELIHDWRPLLAKYNKKDFIAGTTYINL